MQTLRDMQPWQWVLLGLGVLVLLGLLFGGRRKPKQPPAPRSTRTEDAADLQAKLNRKLDPYRNEILPPKRRKPPTQ